MTCRESLSLGAYLLGALEPAERSGLERHMVRCAECRAERTELEPLVELLQHVPFEEPPQRAQAVFRVARRARGWRLFIAGALAAAAALTGIGVSLSTQSSRPATVRSAVTVSATDPATHVTASAALAPGATGTSIRIRLSGLPPAVCRLVMHARDGHTETAATWTSGYGTAVSVPASSSFGVRDIARMDVVTSSDRLLVELRPK